MNLPAALYAVRWLVRDTFRQARAGGIFWVMLAVSALCIVFCLSVSIDGGDPVAPLAPGEFKERLPPHDPQVKDRVGIHDGVDIMQTELVLGFGAFRIPFHTYRQKLVHFIQLLLAGGVADAAGILLTLIWTAGFLPTFLEPSQASVLLAKPVPRWTLLLGKYVGVLAFVLVQAVVFVGGTWMALGLRTGIWDAEYLWAVPMLLLHFSVFFSFSVLLAVCTRSTVVCVFGSILFWLLCWGMNFGRHASLSLTSGAGATQSFSWAVEAGYWLLPKPADMGMMLFEALRAHEYFGQALDAAALREAGLFHPDLSVLSSLAFAAAILAMAAHEFNKTDY